MINNLPDTFDLKNGRIPYSPLEQLEKVNEIIKYLKEREGNQSNQRNLIEEENILKAKLAGVLTKIETTPICFEISKHKFNLLWQSAFIKLREPYSYDSRDLFWDKLISEGENNRG